MHPIDRWRSGNLQLGFSYIWVLILVALIGLGLSKAAEVISKSVQRDEERALLAIGHEFRNAIATYHQVAMANGLHQYPQSLDNLVRDDRSPGLHRHLRRIYFDPLTGRKEWGLIKVGGRIVGVYSLSARRAIKRQGFEPDDQQFSGKDFVREWVFAHPPNVILQAAGREDGVYAQSR